MKAQHAEVRGRIREPRVAPDSASRSHSSPEPPPLSTPTPACSLGANPFPEVTDLFCRLPLPTLFCRPEAFSLGDRLRLTVRIGARERDLPRIFQAHGQATLLHARSAAFQDSKPCPSLKLFKGQGSTSPSKRDDGVIRGLQTRSPGSSLRCRFISLQPSCGMFTHPLSANL